MEVSVVKGDRPSLFGRGWLAHIRLDWKGIFRVSESLLKVSLWVVLNGLRVSPSF